MRKFYNSTLEKGCFGLPTTVEAYVTTAFGITSLRFELARFLIYGSDRRPTSYCWFTVWALYSKARFVSSILLKFLMVLASICSCTVFYPTELVSAISELQKVMMLLGTLIMSGLATPPLRYISGFLLA